MSRFHEKTCNYAFVTREEEYRTIFPNKELEADFDNIDSCLLWAAYVEFVEGVRTDTVLICEKDTMKPVMWIQNRDQLLEYAWATLTDVNIDEEEQTEQDWFIFPAGTSREEIWHWFDERYSKGVGELMYTEAPKEAACMVFPQAGHKTEILPWTPLIEDGEWCKNADGIIQNALMIVLNAEYELDDAENAAVLIAPAQGSTRMGEITAVLADNWETPGAYTLYVYDRDLLFHEDEYEEEEATTFHADGLKEATENASEMILCALEGIGGTDAVKKRYLKC